MDISNAGKRQGMSKDSGTRSGTLWEVERLLNECDELPQVLLMENVPQIHGKSNISDFNKWINSLSNLGYSSYYQDVTSKDHNVPQSRNRCFMVSILDKESKYKFPNPVYLSKRLKDYLEDDVDEKYFLSDDKVEQVISCYLLQERKKTQNKNNTLDKPYMIQRVGDRNQMVIAAMRGRNPDNPKDRTRGIHTEQQLEINYSGLSNCLTTVQKDNLVVCGLEPKILDRIYNHRDIRVYDNCPTLRARTGLEVMADINDKIRIRKLTPLEYWRLMGFSDDDFNKAKMALNNTFYNGKNKSGSQLYKMAGNSIVVDVLMAIFSELK